MSSRNGFVEELALTVEQLFANGKTDPRAREIAEAHFKGLTVPDEIVGAVASKLRKVRTVLEEAFDRPVCLVNQKYYRRFRHTPPETEGDARGCLAGVGYGARAEGVYLHLHGDSDLIWRASVNRGFTDGAPKVQKAAERVESAVNQGRISISAGEDMFLRARRGLPEQLHHPALPNPDNVDSAEVAA